MIKTNIITIYVFVFLLLNNTYFNKINMENVIITSKLLKIEI